MTTPPGAKRDATDPPRSCRETAQRNEERRQQAATGVRGRAPGRESSELSARSVASLPDGRLNSPRRSHCRRTARHPRKAEVRAEMSERRSGGGVNAVERAAARAFIGSVCEERRRRGGRVRIAPSRPGDIRSGWPTPEPAAATAIAGPFRPAACREANRHRPAQRLELERCRREVRRPASPSSRDCRSVNRSAAAHRHPHGHPLPTLLSVISGRCSLTASAASDGPGAGTAGSSTADCTRRFALERSPSARSVCSGWRGQPRPSATR